ncbi:hypothetical protein NCAS_0F02470 [Naumovozyma castellii]|uniref:MAGE domain-containing protein n=1 Tax=Naumovozyma castellii TaxID=27288 RepID=G0VGW0_NAUCA|nr:hypothetical protein NCAS_0F02470 [Naumovozyma castellii CBS 4309]CCC70731.1 hypothetical protein NCAS_0F02470 [Naumovozyma castellii CBS 4309]
MSIDEEYQEGTASTYDNKKVIVARKAVRYILSTAESQNTIISDAKLKKTLAEMYKEENVGKTISFNTMFIEINKILGDVYGYELKGLQAKIAANATKSTQSKSKDLIEFIDSRAKHFILLNKMPYLNNFDEFKLLQSIRTYEDLIVNGEYVGDDMGLESSNTLESKLNVDQDLVFKGLLSVVLCAIIFSKNNILHQELLTHLEKFGVPTDGNRIPVINWNIDELMKILERREYVTKMEEKSDVAGEVILYRIGRRTQVEFDLDSLTALVKEVTGLDGPQAEGIREDVKKSVGDAYPRD